MRPGVQPARLALCWLFPHVTSGDFGLHPILFVGSPLVAESYNSALISFVYFQLDWKPLDMVAHACYPGLIVNRRARQAEAG